MVKEIKQKIVLEGEKQYNQAIKDAQRNLRTLKSELKAETAELGKNATEQQKNEAKAKSLKAQIKEQEEIVKALKDALAEVKDKYSDNADEIAKLEIKLNNARTTLANMQNELQGVGDGLTTISTDAAAATVATKSVADAMSSLGDTGSSIAGVIENVFTTVTSKIYDAVTELWDIITDTASKADNYSDIAGYWGTSAQTIQQYSNAVKGARDSFDDLNSAVTRIVLGGKQKDITELVGISQAEGQSDWDYAIAVMNELYDMQQKGTKMDSIYETIFGSKKSTAVMDLINDWDKITDNLDTYNGNESAYGMSDEEIDTMADLWIKLGQIETKWQALKDNFAAGFGETSLSLALNAEGALDGFAEYMTAETDGEREEALQKIRTNIEQFFIKLGDAIREGIQVLSEIGEELQESDDPVVQAIGSILSGLTNALQWMVENADKVQEAFEIIFGAWLLAKLAAVGGQLTSIIANIETIKAFKGVSLMSGAEGSTLVAGSGTGTSLVTTAGYLAVAVMMLAPTIEKLLKGDIGEGETEKELRKINDESGDKTPLGGSLVIDEMVKKSGVSTQDILLTGFRRAFNTGNRDEGMILPEGTGLPEADTYYPGLEGGAGADATELQKDAAETFWDVYRKTMHGDEVGEDEYDAAFEGFKTAYADDMDTFLKMYSLMEILAKEAEAEENQGGYEDLPAEWWSTLTDQGGSMGTGMPGTGGTANENGVGSPMDARSFLSMSEMVQAACKLGVQNGLNGVEVKIDGEKAGTVLAPYVSIEIAKGIN